MTWGILLKLDLTKDLSQNCIAPKILIGMNHTQKKIIKSFIGLTPLCEIPGKSRSPKNFKEKAYVRDQH